MGLLPFSLKTAAAMVFVAYLPEEMTSERYARNSPK